MATISSRFLGSIPEEPVSPQITSGNIDFLRQEPISIGQSRGPRNPLLKRGLDARFNDIRRTLGFPSSVEEVRQEVENEQFQQTLSQIDQLFGQRLAETRGSLADRGLIGPGATSDIAENALAQVRSGAASAGGQFATQLRLGELDRLSQRERDISSLSESILSKEFSGEQSEFDRGLTRDITQAQLQGQRDIAFGGLSNELTLGAPRQALAEREFAGGLGFNFAELEQRGELERERFSLERELQQLRGQQQLESIRAGKKRSGLETFTGIAGGFGNIAGGLSNLFSIGGKSTAPR